MIERRLVGRQVTTLGTIPAPFRTAVNGPPFLTNNLVGYWDAGNPYSYPSSGTSMTDLSGNGNTATLQNTPTFNADKYGILTFDGVDEYATITGSTTTSTATFLAFIRRNGTQPSNGGIVFSRGASASNGLNFYSTTHRVGYTWASALNTYTWASGPVIPDATWCMTGITIGASAAIAYLFTASGLTTATNSVSHGSTTVDALRIGDPDHVPGRYYKGDIALAMFYSRVLSDAEMRQTFDAFRWRFGI